MFGTWSSNPRRKLRAKGMSYETLPNYLTVYVTYSRAMREDERRIYAIIRLFSILPISTTR